MNYDRYHLSMQEWCLYSTMGILFCGVVSYTYYRSVLVFFCLMPFGIAYPLYEKRNLKKKRLRRLSVEFKEGITILASSLSAGYSVENAFTITAEELDTLYGKEGMMVREFQYMVSQIHMNRAPDKLLLEFGERCGLDDVKNFAEVFAVAKKNGGELVGIISHTAGIIRDKIQVQEEIMTITASKQFEQKIMNMIPYLIVIYIDTTSPGFFYLMYTTGMGRILMTFCLMVYLLAFFLAQKVLDIEV